MANKTKTDEQIEAPNENVGRPSTGVAGGPLAVWWWGIAIVLVLTFAAYAPTLRYQFVHDDRGQIVENPAAHSWRAVPTYFTAQVWAGVMPEELGNYYRPLFLLWVRVNDAVFGNAPWGWHLTTVLAHLLTTLLVYLLALRLEIDDDVALLAALIFGLHPAHIEAVAWISGVTEPLLAILLIASLLAYLHAENKTPRAFRWKLASVGFFALALLEKETALILPGILICYEWFYGAEREQRLEMRRLIAWCGNVLAKIWPYFIVIALYVPARIHALKGFSHVVAPMTTQQMMLTWPALVEFWLRHLLWPVDLSTFYNLTAVMHPTFANFTLPAIIDLSVAVALFAAVRNSRTASFFAIWLVLPLAPLLNIRVFLRDDFAHDRYLYLPSVGFAVLVAIALKRVWARSLRRSSVRAALLGTAVCLAPAMGYGTIRESLHFKDNLTFFEYILARTPHNPYAESNYGILLAENGQYGAALERFRTVAKYHPDYQNAIYNLALTFYKMGDFPEAEESFLRAIQMNPNKPDEYFYLGLTRFKTGRTAEAIECLRQAIAIRPNGFAYHLALGVMLKSEGNMPGALREFEQELASNPGEPAAAEQVREIEGQLAAHPGTQVP